MAQLSESSVIEGGSPIVGQSTAPMMGSYETVVDGGYVDGGYVDGGYVDEGYVTDGGCATCGDSYFSSCDDCCGRGGCPPGPCWITSFGGLLRNAEYFAGANGFQNGLFADPTSTSGNLLGDCSFGFYEGFNVGIPLCRLSCGLLSGQFGLRATQTNFNGNEFTPADRNQIFLTTGLYRRVDYGFQMGVVADILWDDWFTTENSETVQLEVISDGYSPTAGRLAFAGPRMSRTTINRGRSTGSTSPRSTFPAKIPTSSIAVGMVVPAVMVRERSAGPIVSRPFFLSAATFQFVTPSPHKPDSPIIWTAPRFQPIRAEPVATWVMPGTSMSAWLGILAATVSTVRTIDPCLVSPTMDRC